MSVKSRIEQQIIGAVLSGRTLPPEAQLLRARDLEHPVAGIVLGDIADMRQFGHRNATGTQIASDLVASKAYRLHFGLSAATLTSWCEPEITDTELAGGIRMFLRLGADNEIKDLTSAVVQSLPCNDNGYMTGIYQRDLGTAITRRFETLEFTSAPDPARDQLLARYSQVTPLPKEQDEQRAIEEEIVLAGLLSSRSLAWTAAGIITESLFTSDYHRQVYRAIDHVHRHDNPEHVEGAVLCQLMKARHAADGGTQVWDCREDQLFMQELLEIAVEWNGDVTPEWTMTAARQLIADDLRDSLHAATGPGEVPGHDSVALVPPLAGGTAGAQLRP